MRSGRIDLHLGSVERLPFADNTFDRAFAVNSMQVWPDAVAGLFEIRRVLRRGGRIALGFTPPSGQPKEGIAATLAAAGFAFPKLAETDAFFCVLATKP
jgi:ubiquinone/menaquinone biosynthesis C-methylase UbiE